MWKDLLRLWELIVPSEVPEAIAAVGKLREMLSDPKWSDPEWLTDFGEALVLAAKEATDVTRTETDDQLVQRVVDSWPHFRKGIDVLLGRATQPIEDAATSEAP